MTTVPSNQPSNTDLLIMLVRVETKIDAIVAKADDHEARLRILEKARWPLPSVGALTGVAGVIVATYSLYH